MTFDPKKPFTTLDGRKARLLAEDLKSEHPLVIAVETPHMKVETVQVYRKDGTSAYAYEEDTLVNILERNELFINVYNQVCTFTSLQKAKNAQCSGAIGVMRVVKAGKKSRRARILPK